MDLSLRRRAQQLLDSHVVFGSDRDASQLSAFLGAGGSEARFHFYDSLCTRWLLNDVSRVKPAEVLKALLLFRQFVPRSKALRKQAQLDLNRISDKLLVPKSPIAKEFQELLQHLGHEFPADFLEIVSQIASRLGLRGVDLGRSSTLNSEQNTTETQSSQKSICEAEASEALCQVDRSIALLLEEPDESFDEQEISEKNRTMLLFATECWETARRAIEGTRSGQGDQRTISDLSERLSRSKAKLDSLSSLLGDPNGDNAEESDVEFEDVEWA